MSGWMAYELVTHQFGLSLASVVNVNFVISLIYCITPVGAMISLMFGTSTLVHSKLFVYPVLYVCLSITVLPLNDEITSPALFLGLCFLGFC